MDLKRMVTIGICLAALVGGYFLLKFVLLDQMLFVQKQLGDPAEFATPPSPAAPLPSATQGQPAAAKEYDVWFRVSGASPEAKVTYRDAAGEKGGVVVQLPWQASTVARQGDRVSLSTDNETAKDLVAEIFVSERTSAGPATEIPAGAVPWQRATVGSYGRGQCSGIVGQ